MYHEAVKKGNSGNQQPYHSLSYHIYSVHLQSIVKTFKDLTRSRASDVSPVRLAERMYEHGDAGQVDASALSGLCGQW